MNKKILLLLILLLIPIVSAININEDYEVTTINKCYGDITIKIHAVQDDIGGDNYFVGCDRLSYTSWKCNCNQYRTPIIFHSNVKNIYDVVIEYYIEPITGNDFVDDNYKRTLNFNNLDFKTTKNRQSINLPSVSGLWIIIFIIFIIVIVFSFFIYLVIKNLLNDKDNQIENKKNKNEKVFNGFETYK